MRCVGGLLLVHLVLEREIDLWNRTLFSVDGIFLSMNVAMIPGYIFAKGMDGRLGWWDYPS